MIDYSEVESVRPISKEYVQHLLHDEHYQAGRRIALLRDNYRCRICGSTYKIETHHIRRTHIGQEDSFPEDLMCLCDRHHKWIHQYFKECDYLKAFHKAQEQEEYIQWRQENPEIQ